MKAHRLHSSATRREFFLGSAFGVAVPLVVSAHGVRAADEGVTPTDAKITITPDVVYGTVDGHDLTMTIVAPPSTGVTRGAVIALHGGAFTGLGGDMVPNAMELAKHGYVSFVVFYRLLPQVGTEQNVWPAQLDDVQRAVRWIRANSATYEVDPGRVCAYGRSTGAYLASLLGVLETRDNTDPALSEFSSRVNCVAEFDGEQDLTIPYESPTDQDNLTRLLGGTAAELPAVYADASPITHVDEQTAPFLIFSAAGDEMVANEHAHRMVDALTAVGIDTVFIEMRVGHMQIADWALTGPYLLAFFDRYG